MPSVRFFTEQVKFQLLKPRKTSKWIKEVILTEGCTLHEINFIFCSDKYLLQINQEYLDHNTFTDIITFDNSEGLNTPLQGDIFISVERVKENAANLGRPFSEELHRVIIHGVLHLIGYSDKSTAQKNQMRQKEDACLSLPGVPRETWL